MISKAQLILCTIILTSFSSCLSSVPGIADKKTDLEISPDKGTKQGGSTDPGVINVPQGSLFSKAIETINNKCLSCHSSSGSAYSYSFEELDTEEKWISENYITPGNAQDSSLYFRIKGSTSSRGPKTMPIGDNISPSDVKNIRDWINSLTQAQTPTPDPTPDPNPNPTPDPDPTPTPTPTPKTSFQKAMDVISGKCLSCHSSGASNFSLLTTEDDWINSSYIVAGDTLNSRLYYRVKDSDGSNGPKNMPLGGNLSLQELADIKVWLDSIESPNSNPNAFVPTPAYSYGNKIKNIISGLPLTESELNTLNQSPDNLENMVNTWLQTPQAEEKLLTLFEIYFQQTGAQFSAGRQTGDYAESNVGGRFTDGSNILVNNYMEQSYRESLARTALHYFKNDIPFNNLAYTDTFMVTTAMLYKMSMIDDYIVPDGADGKARTPAQNRPDKDSWWISLESTIPHNTVLLKYSRNLVPWTETLDPTSPNFLTFQTDNNYFRGSCFSDKDLATPTANSRYYRRNSHWKSRVYDAIFGYHDYTNRSIECGNGSAASTRKQEYNPILPTQYFNDWRLVKFRTPASNEQADNLFSDFANKSTVIFNIPRIGFFSTPAFLGQWPTNVDNDARVTATQALIAAFGKSFDPDSPILFSDSDLPSSVNSVHADPTTSCFSCHQSLDPMRQVFKQNLTVYYTSQPDISQKSIEARFNYGGVNVPLNTFQDLGLALGNHNLFATGWVQKLCLYSNSKRCPEDSTEFQDIVTQFRSSNYNFKTLMKKFFSSSLVTNRSYIERGTATNMSIARKNHFCHALSNRIEIEDVCDLNLKLGEQANIIKNSINDLSKNIPSDFYKRGKDDPDLGTSPSLFSTSTIEKICSALSEEPSLFIHTASDAVLVNRLTEELIGVTPSHPAYTNVKSALAAHLSNAITASGDRSLAIKSTFMVACQSPTLTMIGI